VGGADGSSDLAKEAPIYHTGLYVDVGCWCAVFVLVLLMGGYLKYLNLRQERRREAMGRIGRMVDTSIMTLEESAVSDDSLGWRSLRCLMSVGAQSAYGTGWRSCEPARV
jgi:hypothetical protein